MMASLSFNLWTEPWIRVIRRDGSDDEIGIGACLTDAHELAALSDPSPLVVCGTHRLLTAILQAIHQPQDIGEIAALLRNAKFDRNRLQAFEKNHAGRFDLFDPQAPFLQTGDVPLHSNHNPQPVARLFAEIPVATERVHFTHVTDDRHRICPACCARGLVTVPAFASSGGSGMRPSINGVPPIYVLPAGDTLFETLTLSLVSSDYLPPGADPKRADQAIWNSDPPVVGKNREVSAVGYLESLTFPARRMRLYPQAGSVFCTNCGRQTDMFVATMLFEMGHWLSKQTGVWEDPFVAFRKPSKQSKNADLKPIRPEEGKAIWRKYAVLLLDEDAAGLRPRIVRQLARLIDRGTLTGRQRLRFRCIGIRTDGKAKIFEWLDEALEAPPELLQDPDAAAYVGEALRQSHEVAAILKSAFERHFRPERGTGGSNEQKFTRFKTVLERLIADYWRRLGLHFRQFVNDLSDARRRDAAAQQWATLIIKEAQACFRTALDQTGDRADALRIRVEAQAECERRLHARRKEWLDE